MGGWVWLAPVGTVIGAVLAYFGARAGVRADRAATAQRERAGRREEWGRRFSTALEYLGNDRARMRAVGAAMLSQLLRSELATSDDRELGEQALAAALARSALSAGTVPLTFDVDEDADVRDDQGNTRRGTS